MSTKWSHLPNAHLIDWVLESVKTDPEAWKAAWDAAWAAWAAREVAWEYGRMTAWYAAWEYGRMTAWDAARDAVWDATRDAAQAAEGAAEGAAASYAAWYAAWYAARDAAIALIADDTAAQYLHMGPDKLKVWVILSEKPAAYLLIPANQIWQREHARAVVHE